MSEDQPQFRLETFGGLALYRRGEDDPLLRDSKALALVAFLALTPDRRSRRPYLARLLWPDADRAQRLRSLRQALYYLTERAGQDLFRRGDGVLALREDRLRVDLWQFDEALEEGDHERVAELRRGAFLEGFDGSVSREFEHWREAEAERIWSALKLSLRHLVERNLAAGETGAAVAYARRSRDLNPLDESARRITLRALLADGREVEAYQEYRQYATLLEKQLGDSPSGELEAKARQVRELLLEERTSVPDGAASGPGGGSPAASDDPARGRMRETAVLAGAAALLAAAVVWWGPWVTRGAADAFRTVSADVAVQRRGGQWTLQLRRGEPVGLTKYSSEPWARRRPGRPAEVATVDPGVDGLDLALVERPGADTTVLTGGPADEHPLDFSPDGRLLLHDFGVEAGESGRYLLFAGVLDPSSGRRWALAPDTLTDVREGSWSPYGTRVALAGGPRGAPRDVWVVPVRGGPARNLTRDSAADFRPAWSPEAGWIAFSSDRSGNRDIYVVRPDGTALRQVTRHPAADRTPVWVSTDHLAFVSERGRGSHLWGFYLPTGERRRLSEAGDLSKALDADLRTRGRWIDSVAIRPDRRVAAAGEYLRPRAAIFDVRGRRHPGSAPLLRWSVSDSSRLVPTGDDLLRFEPGDVREPVRVRADLGGWRADTLRLRPASLRAGEREILLTETWTGRPFAERWIPYGEPPPALRADPSGRFTAAVDPSGDAHFDSGMVTADPISLRGGATISVRAKGDFARPNYQELHVRLARDAPREGDPAWRRQGVPLTLVLDATTPLSLVAGDLRVDLPLPVDRERWHRYTLQVTADGSVWVLVDGRLLWRSGRRLDPESLSEMHLELAGRSRGVDLLFGPVRVYEGARYRLARGEPRLPPRTAPAGGVSLDPVE